MHYNFHVFLLIFGLATIAIAADKKKNDSIFVPTKEWQVVEKGTPIPPGLHIRHNLRTGVIEAKLMDENEADKSSKKTVANAQTSLTLHPEKFLTDEESNLPKKEEPTDQVKIPFDDLKAMLKKIKADESDALLKSNSAEQGEPEKRKKFRTYAQLTEELEALKMNISTDSEVITSLLEQFEPYKETIATENFDSSEIENILEILNTLGYLIHQIDNAQMFADMGGMTKVVSPSLNSTNSEIKAEALKLLGTGVQSNPKVQVKALENDFVQKLLHMLSINNKVQVKSRCLFALGALVRNLPAAQKTLVNNGGLEIFGKILADGHFQIQIRVMNLINDLTIERQNLEEIEDEIQKLTRKREYDLTNFEDKLVKQKYCQNLVDLMIRSLSVENSSEIDDFHEVIYESIITLNSTCKADYMEKKETLLPVIQKMLVKYRDFPKISEDGENLNAHHQELLEKILNTVNERSHDEL